MFLFIFSFSIRNYWFSCLATQWNCLENWNYQCWDSNHTEFNITGMCRVLHHIIYFLNIYWFERETGWREGGREREKKRGRERERTSIFYAFSISWLILVCALTTDRICNPGMSGCCSNQFSYPARAHVSFKKHTSWFWCTV